MSRVLVLTSTGESAAQILPSLSLLDHVVTVAAASAQALPGSSPPPDAVLVDARHHLVTAKELLGQLAGAGIPLLAVISEGAWAAITPVWGVDDVILHSAGPGEVEARIRLAVGRDPAPADTAEVRSGELVIDEATYAARIGGAALDLTFKEFELLKFLAQQPRRVFTRSQLLAEVWGYDYFGGTRTVDVHVRRLRAKLGSDHEALIGTVRNVGYKFVPAKPDSRPPQARPAAQHGSAQHGSAQHGSAQQRNPARRAKKRATPHDPQAAALHSEGGQQ